MLALLLIDIEETIGKHFISKYGPIEDAVEYIRELVKTCKKTGIPVYDIQNDGSIHPALEDLIPPENRFEKDTNNAFELPVYGFYGNEIDLSDYLMDYDALIIIGFNYNRCVKQTAIGASKSGHSVLTCKDYSFTSKHSTSSPDDEFTRQGIRMCSADELEQTIDKYDPS